jgi:hypothetical protein
MREADPVEIDLRKLAEYRLVNPVLLICLEEESAALDRLIHAGDIRAIVKHLRRGWTFRPERGDHDRGPEALKDQN